MLSNFSSPIFLFLKSKNVGMMSRKVHWKKTRTTPTRRAAGEGRPARVQPRPPAGSKWDAHLAEHRESATVQSRTLRRPLRPCEASRRGPKRSRHFFVPCVRKFEILFFWQGSFPPKTSSGPIEAGIFNFFLKSVKWPSVRVCCTSSWAAEKYLDWSNPRPVKRHVLIGGDFSNLKFLAGKKNSKKIAEDKEKREKWFHRCRSRRRYRCRRFRRRLAYRSWRRIRRFRRRFRHKSTERWTRAPPTTPIAAASKRTVNSLVHLKTKQFPPRRREQGSARRSNYVTCGAISVNKIQNMSITIHEYFHFYVF